MPIESKSDLSKYFLPIDDKNKQRDIERPTNRETHRGAFTPAARLALALAVKAKKPQVTMDQHIMVIRYRDQGVFVKAMFGSLPCGEFHYDTLREHIKKADANVKVTST